MRFLTATLIWAAMVVAAAAAPGQCSVTGYDSFDCDVALDGGGLTFELPDGAIFAFAVIEDGMGEGYVIAADAAPGQPPQVLRDLRPVDGQPGCWARDEDYQFCVLLEQ
ncbi:hypothetical protein [Devosia sp.]|uniref:hypothetical protein n=1 Tax=Devosia sp. TaxID=1871048 RepID=UPI002FCB0D9C